MELPTICEYWIVSLQEPLVIDEADTCSTSLWYFTFLVTEFSTSIAR